MYSISSTIAFPFTCDYFYPAISVILLVIILHRFTCTMNVAIFAPQILSIFYTFCNESNHNFFLTISPDPLQANDLLTASGTTVGNLIWVNQAGGWWAKKGGREKWSLSFTKLKEYFLFGEGLRKKARIRKIRKDTWNHAIVDGNGNKN